MGNSPDHGIIGTTSLGDLMPCWMAFRAPSSTDLLRRDGFTENRPEQTKMKEPCNAHGIPAIRLDRHGLQGTFHLSCFHQDDIQPGICQPTMQPL
jgi:hypothetical protein